MKEKHPNTTVTTITDSWFDANKKRKRMYKYSGIAFKEDMFNLLLMRTSLIEDDLTNAS